MRAPSLRRRVSVTAAGLVALTLLGVLAVVTTSYRAGLRADLRRRLQAAAASVATAGSVDAAKPLVQGLALNGIATTISGPQPNPAKGESGLSRGAPPIKAGGTVSTSAGLLSATEVLPDGSRVTFTASEAPISRSVNRLLTLEVIVGLAALAGILALVSRATRSALRPLGEIVQMAMAISSGKSDRRLNPDRDDTELGVVATALDRMVDSLDAALRDAKRAEETMRRFLGDAAHELRTPIAALQATAERLLREQPERPARDEIEAAVATQAAGLGRLVGDLLDLAALDSPTRRPTQIVDLAEIVVPVVAAIAAPGGRKTIRLDAEPALVDADPDAIQRIARNLVDNAVAAAPTGTVTISVRLDGCEAMLQVRDDGPGIPAEERERIFDRFARMPGTQTPGTGLGLAIARRLAHQNAGVLTCDPADVGATFSLRLPAAPRGVDGCDDGEAKDRTSEQNRRSHLAPQA